MAAVLWMLALLGCCMLQLVSADAESVSCQRLGLRASKVGLDAAVKDIVWLTGQVEVFVLLKGGYGLYSGVEKHESEEGRIGNGTTW